MQSGPGPLDLTTPLMEGMKIGQQGAYQRGMLANAAQANAIAKLHLGVEERGQDMTLKGVMAGIDAEAGVRAAQVALMTQQADVARLNATQLATGVPIVTDKIRQLGELTAAGDYDSIAKFDASVPGGSLEQNDQLNSLKAQALVNASKTTQGQMVMDQHVQTLDALNGYTKAGGQVMQGPKGLIPTDKTMLNPDGSINIGAMNGWTTQKTASNTVALQTSLDNAKFTGQGQAWQAREAAKAQGALETALALGKLPQAVAIDMKGLQTSIDTALDAKSKALPGTDTSAYDATIASGQQRLMQYRDQYIPQAAPPAGATAPGGASPAPTGATPVAPATTPGTTGPDPGPFRAAIAAGRDRNLVGQAYAAQGGDPNAL